MLASSVLSMLDEAKLADVIRSARPEALSWVREF
jgi:hypothetical protein